MNRRLLIADDEPAVRLLVRTTLERDSLQIFEAASGEEAIELARRQQPDVVLLDVMMPGLSGFEVCQTLKSEPATAAIKVILLTGKTQEEDRDRGNAVGADGYFTKPFSPLALLTKVDEVLEESGQR